MTRPLVRLFSPIRIGTLALPNRLVMSPMTTGYAGDDLLPSPRLLAYLEARARGGVGLITLEACSVDRRHREVPRSMHFSDDSVIEAHRALSDRVHAAGAKVQPQLVHPGPDGLAPFFEKIPSLGPSVIPSYLTGTPCRELEVEEIAEIVELYGAAARRIREAGYDGLELHAAHGYMLLGSFLSPWRNRRSDAYRGDTDEGRTRMLTEVLSAIRREAGDEFPVTLRISGYERVPGGRRSYDTPRIAPRLVEAGVDCFHVSGGVIDRLTSQIVTGSSYGDAHNVAAAAAVKRVVGVPVMAVGRIHDPLLAEEILARGDADLIAMARPLLADPELPAKARAGRVSDLRHCISCQTCIDSMEVGSMRCAINPQSGREGELEITRAVTPLRVSVVGGGPAGLEAARQAALRGHRVQLHERENQLGGAFRLAATVHPENQPFLRFLQTQIERLPIDVRLGSEVDAGRIASSKPDAVIVATGARIATPAIPGDDLPHVWSGPELRGLLSGDVSALATKRLSAWQRWGAQLVLPRASRLATPERMQRLPGRWIPVGPRVAIVGGDLAAVELAEFLAQKGRRVRLFEVGDEIAPEVGLKRRTEHMDRLDRLGVSVNTGIEIEAISATGLRLKATGGGTPVDADTVILAGHPEPDTRLFESIRERVPRTFAIGDCTGLGLVAKATDEAARIVAEL
jgi:2,4-dienoyl-CoA reductase (NADPH2)